MNNQARPAEAVPHLELAHALYLDLFGVDSSAALASANNLALAYRGVNRLDESAALLRPAVDFSDRADPEKSRYPAEIVNLGDTYMWQGRYADAEQLYRRF